MHQLDSPLYPYTTLFRSVYPEGFDTRVEVGGLTAPLDGAARPGHFEGVTTVVAKLFNMAGPDVAYFGQKDAQQALVIRDRKSTRLNSSHVSISYAVFCLK